MCVSRWRCPSRLLLYSGTAVKIDKQFHRYTVLRSHGEAVSALRLCASWSSIASGPTYELDKRFSWMMTKDETILRSEKLKKTYLYSYTRYNLIQGPAGLKKFRSAVYLLHLIYTVLLLDSYPGFDAAEAAHILLYT